MDSDMPKLVKITMSVSGQEALSDALGHVPGISLECGPPSLQEDGTYAIVVYGSEAQAKKLAKNGTIIELDREFGAALEERRKEVGVGDRFEGGAVVPRGLGTAVER